MKSAETKLDSFAENQAYSCWSYLVLFWGHDSNNLKIIIRNEILIQFLARPFLQIYSSSEVSGGGVEGISGFFNTPLMIFNILFVFSSSIG